MLRFTTNVDCSAPAFSACGRQDVSLSDRKRNGIRKKDIKPHPIKSSQYGCALLGVFCCSRKGQAIPREPLQGSPGMAPVGCRGGRNEMLSPGKGKPWATDGQGTDSRHPEKNTISILYIPQFLPRGQRYFFIRHISIFSPDRLQKNT